MGAPIEDIKVVPSRGPEDSTASPTRLLTPDIAAFSAGAYAFIQAHRATWTLDQDVDLEVNNHVLRVLIQDGSIAANLDHLVALCHWQHADGGWGDRRDDPVSQLRSTSFCVQMLLRAARQVADPTIDDAVRRGLAHIAAAQAEDGSWRDRRWHQLDACSTSLGTLLFATNEAAYRSTALVDALHVGMAFIDRQRGKDGLWRYKSKSSPVTITAHLVQKTAIYHGFSLLEARAVDELLRLQHPDGHWDEENIDHTCDAARSLMLVASCCDAPRVMRQVDDAATRSVGWLLQVATDGALGDRPGFRPHVERTCDGLDTLLKFKSFRADASRLHNFWH